ncbi:hypothetical protein KGQ74_03050, partial [Patescibacteria group bacterium]|nr:hypothetical protein [Patescibacteria group bacterium]
MFIAVILSVRTAVFLFPSGKILIAGMHINHFWIGVLLVAVGLSLRKKYSAMRMVSGAVGSALIADELVFLLATDRTLGAYWSACSLAGVAVGAMAVFMFRKRICDTI